MKKNILIILFITSICFAAGDIPELYKACTYIITAGINSTDKIARIESLRLVPGLNDKSQVSKLKNLLQSDTDDGTIIQVVAGLNKFGDSSQNQLLSDIIKKRGIITQEMKPIERARVLMRDNVRANAVKAVGDIGDKTFVPLLKKLSNDAAENGRVRDQAMISQAKLGDRESSIKMFMFGMDSIDTNIRRQSCIAMGELKESSALPKLVEQLSYFDKEIKSVAAISIGKIGEKKIAPYIKELLSNKEPSVQISGCDALGMLGDANYIPQLKEMINNENGTVKLAAAISLIKLGDFSEENIMFQAFDSTDFDAKLKSAQALTEYGKPGHLDKLGTVFNKEQNPTVKLNIANAIVQICNREKLIKSGKPGKKEK